MEVILELLMEKVVSFALNRRRPLFVRLFVFFLFWIPFLSILVLIILNDVMISGGWAITFAIFLVFLCGVFYLFDRILKNESPPR